MAEERHDSNRNNDRPPNRSETTIHPLFTGSSLEKLDSEPKAFLAEYEPNRDSPSVAVVASVASVLGKDPLELEPLSSAIDPDALDTLVEYGCTTASAEVGLTFQYMGLDVQLRDNAQVRITG